MMVKAEKSGQTVKLYIYGEIVADAGEKWGVDDVCPMEVVCALEDADGREVELHINSPGGDCFAAAAIYNSLLSYKGQVVGIVDGLAASAASIIAMACKTLRVPENAYLMLHHAWAVTAGNAAELRETAGLLDKLDGDMVSIYSNRMLSEKAEEAGTLMDKSSWISGKEAAELFAHVTTLPAVKAVALAGSSECLARMGTALPDGLKELCPEAEAAAEKLLAEEEEKLRLILELL